MPKKEQKKPKVATVLGKNRESLMLIPGVVGVGIGGSAESPVIIVMVKQSTPELKKQLPRELKGFPVEVEVSGEVTAF